MAKAKTSSQCAYCRDVLVEAVRDLIEHHDQQRLDMSTLWTKQHVKDMVGEVLDEINLMHLMPRELLQEDETSSFSSSASSDMGKEKEGEKEKGKGKEKQKDDEEEKGNEKKEVQKKDRKGKGKGRLVDDEANSPFKASSADVEMAKNIRNLYDALEMDELLCILRHHKQSTNIEAVLDTLFSGVDMAEWWAKDKALENLIDGGDKEEVQMKNSVQEEELRESQLIGLNKEDVERARNIRAIVGKDAFSMNDILCVLRNHPQSSNNGAVVETLLGGIDMDEWREKDKELLRKSDTPANFDCNICYEEFAVTDMFTLDCKGAHRFCFDCIRMHAETEIKGSGRLPQCPACEHVISQVEIKQICGVGELLEKYDQILLRRGLNSLEGCIGCPTPGCNNWIVADPKLKTRCFCSGCNFTFCSICREMYHYGEFTCDQVKAMAVQYMEYELDQKARNAEDLKKREARKKELKKKMEELRKDEEWKEKNLKLCPKCSRPIEKTGGCNSMVCGQNADGGNIQNGCGHRFGWDSAPKYVKKEWNAHLEDAALKGYGDEKSHEYWKCDICDQDIKGSRFRCLHCPVFNLCQMCEAEFPHFPKHQFAIIK